MDSVQNLRQPSDKLRLPKAYKELAAIFERLDETVALVFNRQQEIRISLAKENATRALGHKAVTDEHLQQIRCVFPKAYKYSWEKKSGRQGKDSNDYELHITPQIEPEKKLTPKILTERKRIFTYRLLTVVQDHHQEFLKNEGLEIENNLIFQWHKNFNENIDQYCPGIDVEEFPPKPYVETPERNASEMLAKIIGLNPSVEKALKRVENITTPAKNEDIKTPIKKVVEDIVIDKRLQGLSPQILEKFKAKQRAKQIKEMTRNDAQQKEIDLLNGLLHNRFYSTIINCHNNEKTKAVPFEKLCKRIADSSNPMKSKNEVIELLNKFIEIGPKFKKKYLEKKDIKKVTQVLRNYNQLAPEYDDMEEGIKKILDEKMNAGSI